jgi:hypothetical protein
MQLQKIHFAVCLSLFLFGGCNQLQSDASQTKGNRYATSNSEPEQEQELANESQLSPTQQTSRAIESQIKKGMSYADLRKLVVDSGWNPVVDSECKSNVVGANFKKTCELDHDLEACKICDHLPELSSCSGDAYCGMFFSNGSEKLHVVTFGDFSDWDVLGAESQLSVQSWDISKD